MSAPYSPGHGRILHAGGMTSSAIGRSVAEMDEQGVARTDAERGPGGGDGLVGIDLAPGQLLVAVEFEPRQLERIVAGPEHLHPDPRPAARPAVAHADLERAIGGRQAAHPDLLVAVDGEHAHAVLGRRLAERGLDLLPQAHERIVRLGWRAEWSSTQTTSSLASSKERSCAGRAGVSGPRPARIVRASAATGSPPASARCRSTCTPTKRSCSTSSTARASAGRTGVRIPCAPATASCTAPAPRRTPSWAPATASTCSPSAAARTPA